MFQVSIAGIVIGIFTGLAAVMIATVSPVRYVCSIPPLTAINEETYQKDIKCRKKRRTIKIPVELLISLRQKITWAYDSFFCNEYCFDFCFFCYD